MARLMAKKRARKPGPKPKPPEAVRGDSIRFMVTSAEKDFIERGAQAAKRTLSDYVRLVLLQDASKRLDEPIP